jgi:ATP-binding cassette subfamily C (CFTR/MRP) protein 1
MLQKYYLRTSRQLRFLDLESKSSLYSQLLESLSGLTTIRAFGWQRESELQNFKFLDVSQKPYYLLLSIQRWLNFTIDMIVTGMAFVLIILVVELRGLVSPGFTGIALLNVMTFNYSLKAVINAWTSLETSIGSVSRIRTFAASTESEDKPEECQQPPKDWPNKGSIEIRGLSASYR